MKHCITDQKQKVQADEVMVAVDIGKSLYHVRLSHVGGEPTGVLRVPPNRPGLDGLWARIRQYQRRWGRDRAVVGFESTGPYGELLVEYCWDKPVRLVQVNPKHTKRVKEVQDNSPQKSDAKDPRVIATLMELGSVLSVVAPEGAAAELRRLMQAREAAVARQTASGNRMQQLVFVLFPELSQVWGKLTTRSGLHLVQHYADPAVVRRLGEAGLWAQLRQARGCRWRRAKVAALVAAAHQSVGVRRGQVALQAEVAHLAEDLMREQAFLRQLEARLEAQLAQVPASRYLRSVKGVGRLTAAGLIGEVGDFGHYATARDLLKLGGLNLYELSSGRHRGQKRISKRGRALMRKLLYLAALNVTKPGRAFYEAYQRMLQRGMDKTKAHGAIARKLLQLLFALVRDQQMYRADYSARLKKEDAA